MKRLFAAGHESVHGPKRQFLRRNHTSEVGGEADMPRQLDQRV